jgi:hypothetical protein
MSIRLCQYSDLFGKPNKGVHAYRIFDVAIVDVLLTVLGAWVIKRFLVPRVEYWRVLATLFILGIALHWLFCVPTKINQLIFNSP